MILKSQTNDARNKALIGIALSPTVKHGQAARNFVFVLDTCPYSYTPQTYQKVCRTCHMACPIKCRVIVMSKLLVGCAWKK